MTDMTDMIADKRILVTGGTGFLGSNLLQRLLKSNASNIISTIHQTEPIINDVRIDYVKCDLLKKEDCKKIVEGIDIIFHCAANTSGAAVMTSSPLDHVIPNIIMNSQLLEAAYNEQIDKFIFISSSAAYPYQLYYPDIWEGKFREDQMFNGDPYPVYYGVAWMKRYTEKLCQLYNSYLSNPIKTVIVRPSNTYGKNDKFDPKKSHVMAATIRKVIERHNPIKVWGDGNDSRDFIFVEDLIDGLILASQTENDVFNIASGINYTVRDILQIALDIEGYNDANIVYDNDKSRSTIPKLMIDTTKAEKMLGFKAKTDIRDGMKKTMEWYHSYYDNQ